MLPSLRRYLTFACASILLVPGLLGQAAKPLEIYFIDVEGGQATLIVSPSGSSVLVDTGWSGFDGRDAGRILAALKAARLKQIDYVIITHYHRDHVGGVAQLLDRTAVGTFVDHGPNGEDSDGARASYAAYERSLPRARHLVVKPGERIPVEGLDLEVLAAAGEHLSSALPGAGQPNPLCALEPEADPDATENARSLGTLLTFGKFRFLDLGDLTKQKERELVCPNNLVGRVDLYLATHHGSNLSNARVLLGALRPRVSIMNNGPHKGGSPDAWDTIRSSPGLLDLWQLHTALDSDKPHNIAEPFIANLDESCEGRYIKVTARPDGSFTVTNSRNNFRKTYPK